MIKIFYGDDRVRAGQEIKKFLGEEYEVVEGVDLTENDLPSLMMGNSLFSEKRKILIRDLTTNKNVCEKLPEYLKTPHDVAIMETKLAKNSAFYKAMNGKVKILEFKLPETNAYRRALNIYNTAKKDGAKAVKMVETLKYEEDAIAFAGMIIAIALKEYDAHPGQKEKRVLAELSKLDIEMKSTTFEPWTLISSWLLRLASL